MHRTKQRVKSPVPPHPTLSYMLFDPETGKQMRMAGEMEKLDRDSFPYLFQIYIFL